jgi:myo-inositol-1(or 4)-monophosphatase
MPNQQSDQEVAVTAAQAGAAMVRARFGGELARFDKGGGDFATEADIEAEKAILDVLTAARPGDTVLGEETGRTRPGDAVLGEETGRTRPGDTVLGEETGRPGTGDTSRVWLVDPLCGTLNYATGTMTVAVNVALQVGDQVTAAAVVDPFGEETFWIGPDGRAYRNGEIVRPAAVPALVDVNLDPVAGGPPPTTAARLISDRGFLARFRPRVLSTTLALTWVAAGRRAAYVTEGDLRDSVHFTAGIALCQAAGCLVTGIEGQPLHTGTGGLVAGADEATHRALLEIMRGDTSAGTD